MITEVDAILSLVPNAILHTDEKGIVWHQENTVPKPTKTAIQAEITRLQNNASILEQIALLEAQQTQRLIREAMNGVQFAVNKLAKIDADIAILRSKLK